MNMNSMRKVLRQSARLLASTLFGLALAGTASASMVDTADVINSEQAAQAREQIKELAKRPELAKQLTELGVAPNQAGARVDAMTDQEVLALTGKLANLPAGGALSNNDLILILLLIILILVL